MTIRKQWLIVLTLTAVLAVLINSLLLSSLISRYFVSYTTEDYNIHVDQIEDLAINALTDNTLSSQQLTMQFESHLDDPILSIKLYNNQGQLVAFVENKFVYMHGMMKGRMPEMMKAAEEVDSVEIYDAGVLLGVLNITRYSSLNNSIGSNLFKFALIRNTVFSFAIVLIVLISIGMIISRRMGRDLTNTASQAINIDLGNQSNVKLSKIKEIKIIQQCLQTLNSKLKIKQIGRKRLIDELVHQVRTPLTILKTHLEGFEDGLIEMTPEEIVVCGEQVDNITSIIANMSMMLDANISSESIKPEKVDINALLKQII
ncbi:MAG TPA: sensor histidine kinase, partial [Clostridia bacterium]|nr:sensor histidine kinase [Clostridia bacterium]